MSSFYQYARDTILIGEMPLPRMLEKLDKLEFADKITPEEHIELANLARDHADPSGLADLLGRIDDHERRLRVLEEGKTPAAKPGEWPEYDPHRGYITGDKISFEGKHYVCQLPEHVYTCTWSPSVYPAYWVQIA